MTLTHTLPDDAARVLCHSCEHEIVVNTAEAVLDRVGYLVRLRCSRPECGRIDWYNESEFQACTEQDTQLPDDAGEVWIHDVLLGLSFRVSNERR